MKRRNLKQKHPIRKMFDPDSIMTSEEKKDFEESLQEYKEGKAVPLKVFEKEYS